MEVFTEEFKVPSSKFQVSSSKLPADLDATSKFEVIGWIALDWHATWNLEPETWNFEPIPSTNMRIPPFESF